MINTLTSQLSITKSKRDKLFCAINIFLKHSSFSLKKFIAILEMIASIKPIFGSFCRLFCFHLSSCLIVNQHGKPMCLKFWYIMMLVEMIEELGMLIKIIKLKVIVDILNHIILMFLPLLLGRSFLFFYHFLNLLKIL